MLSCFVNVVFYDVIGTLFSSTLGSFNKIFILREKNNFHYYKLLYLFVNINYLVNKSNIIVVFVDVKSNQYLQLGNKQC